MSSKILVAYFSASGVTADVAKKVASAASADLFEIRPEKPYTKADLDWMDKTSRTTLEMNDPSCRPVISNVVNNIDAYDTIFLGFPIWWYVEPRIIDTFLESYDFTGKTIIPFATSGGSGLGKTVASMQQHCSRSASIKAGKLLNHGDIASWVRSIL